MRGSVLRELVHLQRPRHLPRRCCAGRVWAAFTQILQGSPPKPGVEPSVISHLHFPDLRGETVHLQSMGLQSRIQLSN